MILVYFAISASCWSLGHRKGIWFIKSRFRKPEMFDFSRSSIIRSNSGKEGQILKLVPADIKSSSSHMGIQKLSGRLQPASTWRRPAHRCSSSATDGRPTQITTTHSNTTCTTDTHTHSHYHSGLLGLDSSPQSLPKKPSYTAAVTDNSSKEVQNFIP